MRGSGKVGLPLMSSSSSLSAASNFLALRSASAFFSLTTRRFEAAPGALRNSADFSYLLRMRSKIASAVLGHAQVQHRPAREGERGEGLPRLAACQGLQEVLGSLASPVVTGRVVAGLLGLHLRLERLVQLDVKLGQLGARSARLLQDLHVVDGLVRLAVGDVGLEQDGHEPFVERRDLGREVLARERLLERLQSATASLGLPVPR